MNQGEKTHKSLWDGDRTGTTTQASRQWEVVRGCVSGHNRQDSWSGRSAEEKGVCMSNQLLRSGLAPIFLFFSTLPFQSRDLTSHGPPPDQSPDFHHVTTLLFCMSIVLTTLLSWTTIVPPFIVSPSPLSPFLLSWFLLSSRIHCSPP